MASKAFKRSAQRAAVAGALAVGAVSASAAPALAEPISVPGVGPIEIPGVTQKQVDDAIATFAPALGQGMDTGNPAPAQAAPVTPAPAPQAPVTSTAERAVKAAETKLGAPYVYGAAGPNAFDCSGLVQWAYKQAGLDLPRTSYDQAAVGVPVSQNNLQVGDVVSFYGGGHSGIYAGNGNVIHASTSGQPVKMSPVSAMPFDGARRYV
ncbi:C40 family peptidase [Rhodococcus xishaensis]|uniref:NlpC/P60 family protein n=1 Tax=Rhodococcus xishaensis TaxID=2487364 RepID=A0A3S3BNT4_9NOCA|nr:C40 family peptidase [Rhodococcus xishaensis]RVW05617.1 NlpC/P60 family protein [Rhodococcus xishaensis]